MATLAKHLPGQHDQSEHGKWAAGRAKVAVGGLDDEYARAYAQQVDYLDEDELIEVDVEEAAPYLKMHVAQTVAERVDTTPEELWALGGIDVPLMSDWSRRPPVLAEAQRELQSKRLYGTLIPTNYRDPDSVTREAFDRSMERLTASRFPTGQEGGEGAVPSIWSGKFDDGTQNAEVYAPIVKRLGLDWDSMSEATRARAAQAVSDSAVSRAATPDEMVRFAQEGAQIGVGSRGEVSVVGVIPIAGRFRARGSMSDPEVVKAGVRVATESMVDAWAAASNYKMSKLSQFAAAAEFGLDQAASQLRDVGATPQELSLARKIVRAQYEATQEQLDRMYPGQTHVALFRGGDGTERYLNAEELEALGPSSGTEAVPYVASTLRMRPLASFTAAPRVTATFFSNTNETLFAAAVPKERIFSTAVTGFGAANEYEMVVLGGPIHGLATTNLSPLPRTARNRRAAMRANNWAEDLDSFVGEMSIDYRGQFFEMYPDFELPLGATEFITVNGQPIPIGKSVAKHLPGKHDQSEHGKWAAGRTKEWEGGVPSEAKVVSVGVGDMYGLYESVAGVAIPDDSVLGMEAKVKGELKDAVSRSLAESLTDLSFDDIMATGVMKGGRAFPTKTVRVPIEGRPGMERTEIVPMEPGDKAVLYVGADGRVAWGEGRGDLQYQGGWTEGVSRGTFTDVTIGDDTSLGALRYQFVNETLKGWANSSQSTSSRMLQQAVSEMFGLDRGADYMPEELYAPARPALRRLAEEMYRATQRSLDEEFPNVDHIVLHRGGDAASRFTETLDPRQGGDASISLRPLASFSSDADVAYTFSRNPTEEGSLRFDTFTAVVPKSRIFATPATGIGAADEYEFVVIGGNITGQQMTARNPDEARRSMAMAEFVSIDGLPIPIEMVDE
jgi:hypothetical protein